MERTFTLMGGDARQAHLADLLTKEGYQVKTWGVPDYTECELEEAGKSRYVILPLPLSREAGMLNCKNGFLPLRRLWGILTPDQVICGGQVGAETMDSARERGLQIEDYFLREELTVANAAVTAEGAVQLAMEHLPVTLWGNRCLIIGYGRIGKLLAHRLRGLGAEVVVAARSQAARAWASADGMEAVAIEHISEHLKNIRVLFNTVPSLIMNRSLIECLPKTCLCMDLASQPGIDGTAAEELGVPFLWARGLPGKVAPETAAAAIRDAVFHILEERGETL